MVAAAAAVPAKASKTKRLLRAYPKYYGILSLVQERAAKADVTLVLSSDDFLRLARKELSAQQLFMKGRLRLKGNMGLAMKLGKASDGTFPYRAVSLSRLRR